MNPLLQATSGLYDLDALDREGSSVAVFHGAGEIVWTNRSWTAFAAANGGRAEDVGPGINYFGAIGGDVRSLYELAAAGCLETGEPFEQTYECSSPTVRRSFRMRMFPVRDEGLLVVHRLAASVPHGGPASAPSDAAYRDVRGLVCMCGYCRCVRRADDTAWDWVPEWVEAMPAQVTHGMCPICAAHYWPDL